MPLQEFFDYLEHKQNLKPRSLVEYRRVLNIVSCETDLIRAKNKTEIDNAILRIKDDKNWGSLMTAKAGSILVRFYRWMAAHEKIPYNPYPFSDFKRPKLKEPKWLDEASYNKIMKHPLLSTQDRVILSLLWDTGIRRGELIACDHGDFDLINNMVHIRKEASKGEYSFRWCPFTKETGELIKAHIQALENVGKVSGPVFLDSLGNRLGDNRITQQIAVIGDFFGLKLTPHMFRHGWGGRMLDKGADQLFVMKNLGHASATMTGHYIHLSKNTARKLYDKLVTA